MEPRGQKWCERRRAASRVAPRFGRTDSSERRVSPPGGARNAASWPGMRGGNVGAHPVPDFSPDSAEPNCPREPVSSPCQPRGPAAGGPRRGTRLSAECGVVSGQFGSEMSG